MLTYFQGLVKPFFDLYLICCVFFNKKIGFFCHIDTSCHICVTFDYIFKYVSLCYPHSVLLINTCDLWSVTVRNKTLGRMSSYQAFHFTFLRMRTIFASAQFKHTGIEFKISALIFEQFLVIATFDYPALFKHHDCV